MPKISIHEQDISNVTAYNITENVIFVPGMATQGVFNTPKIF